MPTPSEAPYRVNARKYPDRPHWRYEMLLLGEDEHGLWFHLPSGTTARRGTAPERPIAPGFVALVPTDDPWIVEFYRNHPRHLVYVNIGTVPKITGTAIQQIDLDLDVVLTHEGDVLVLDEDEFLEHQDRFGYPAEIIDLARTAARTAQARLEDRSPPFDGAAQAWLDTVDAATLE